MERSAILADFQACTGIADMEYCISVLDSHNWDLTAAVASSLADGVPDVTQNYQSSTLEPVSSEAEQPFQDKQTGTTDFSSIIPTPDPDTNPMGFFYDVSRPSGISQPPQTDSRPAVERDAGPVMSTGSVRLLHFHIRLALPPGDDSEAGETACEEFFVYPETETVGSLKRHFIDLKLAELTSVATLPEWSSAIPDITPQTLLAHLSFDCGTGHDLNDNSAVLRSLHLPKFNSIDAKLKVHAVPSSTNPVDPHSSENGSESIELRVYVNLTPDSTSAIHHHKSCEYRSHLLHLQSVWRVSHVRRETANVTGIAPNRQLWSEYLPVTDGGNGTSNSTTPLLCLLAELNRRCGSSNGTGSTMAESQNPTLSELGLRSGHVYTLQLSDSSKCGVLPGLSPADIVDAQADGSRLTGSRKSSGSNLPSTAFPAGTADDFDEDVDIDYDLMEGLEPTRSSAWSKPLISDSNEGGDPAEATEQFCTLFIQRYCSDGETMAPPFTTGSLDTALASSVGTTSVSDRKPLFIYLHNDNSVACHVFCQQILCSVEFGQFFGENDFSIWPWDVTRPRAKERLFGWLESKASNLASAIATLSTDSYPVLAMVGKISGQLEVLCVVLGTGAVSGLLTTPPMDTDFPTLNAVNRHVLKPFPNSTSGSLKPDVILAEMWQAYTTYLELLAPEQAAEVERLARQRVRIEQEKAFQESLRLDKLKAENAEREREQQALLEQERLRAKSEASQRRLQVAATLPAEPPAQNTPAAEAFLATQRGASGITSLRFRLPPGHGPSSPKTPDPNNEVVLRRFAGSDTLKNVFAFVESKGFPISDYKLLTTFPRRDLSTLDENASMLELGLVPQETLILEHR